MILDRQSALQRCTSRAAVRAVGVLAASSWLFACGGPSTNDLDAGHSFDARVSMDAGPLLDAAPSVDSGVSADARPPGSDSGMGPDAGHPADSGQPADAGPRCGNHVRDPGEECDGDCPSACMDAYLCSTYVLVGSAADCSAHCVENMVSSCTNGDGCCPSGCSNVTDTDCDPVCGNHVQEMGEVCDGDCPSTCDDGDACTMDVLSGDSATCDAMCSYPPFTACTSGDGCCPTGCTMLSDSDCGAVCGNGVVESGEICDGDCPASCDDGDACTADVATGSASTCDLMCSATPITGCTSGDGCCRLGCTSATDSDCTDGATWHNEVPTAGGEDVNDVWVFSASDVWGVGNHGMIIHWDGTSVTRYPSGVIADLHDLWGVDATHIYASGDDATLLRFDGTAWTPWSVTGASATVAFEGVYASSPADVWLIDASAQAYHYNGSSWTSSMLPLNTAREIAGTGPTAVRVAGSGLNPSGYVAAALATFNGLSWSTTATFGLALRIAQSVDGTGFVYGSQWV